MTEVESKYGFPIFTRNKSSIYLGKNKKIIVSDIWAFWDYVIKKNSKNTVFLTALLEQAKYFYDTAENGPIKSKPLLFYYSFLNFAKILINIEHNYGQRPLYYHGLKEHNQGSFSHAEIEIFPKKNNVKNVAAELMGILDQQSPLTTLKIKVKDLLRHCVGIHRAYSEIYNEDEIFHRLDNATLKKNGKQLSFESIVKCDKNTFSALAAQGYNISCTNGEYKNTTQIPMATYRPGRNDYHNLSTQIKQAGIWYYIGANGYTLYLSSHAQHRYSPETIIYNTMFYLGSITRYHPYMFDKLFSDKEQWLMSEFLTTQPKQFLYTSTAKILGQNILKAYSHF